MSKEYYEEIDILKGIAITLVVLGHSVILYPINLHEIFWCKTIYDFVRTMHMPLFFMVSGFCFSYKNKYGPYIWKKCKRIVIPYLVFNLIDMLPRAMFASLVNKPRSLGESIYSICCEGGAYWFLYSLFLIFLFFPLITKVVKTTGGKIALCAVCLGLKFVPGLPEIFLIKRTIYHLLYFVVGYCLKDVFSFRAAREKVEQYKALSIVLAVAIPISIAGLCMLYAKWDDNQLLGIPLAFMGVFAAMLISILLKKGIVKDHLVGFGKYSLQIYLLNGFMLTLTRTLMVSVLHIKIPAVIIFVNWFVNLVVSYYLIKWIFSRFRITRFMFGMV